MELIEIYKKEGGIFDEIDSREVVVDVLMKNR
jgi:hypothetical protein